jgi:hypothetical protein
MESCLFLGWIAKGISFRMLDANLNAMFVSAQIFHVVSETRMSASHQLLSSSNSAISENIIRCRESGPKTAGLSEIFNGRRKLALLLLGIP